MLNKVWGLVLLAVFVSLAEVRAQGSEEAKKAKAAAMMDRYEKLYSEQRERRIVDDVKTATRATREIINETVVLGESGTGPGVTLTFTALERIGGPGGGGYANVVITSIINGVRNRVGAVEYGTPAFPPIVRTFTAPSGSSIRIETECFGAGPCDYSINAAGGTVDGQGSVTITQAHSAVPSAVRAFVVAPLVVPN